MTCRFSTGVQRRAVLTLPMLFAARALSDDSILEIAISSGRFCMITIPITPEPVFYSHQGINEFKICVPLRESFIAKIGDEYPGDKDLIQSRFAHCVGVKPCLSGFEFGGSVFLAKAEKVPRVYSESTQPGFGCLM